MKIYPDTNILISIEDREFSIETLIDSSDVSFYYSYIHLSELLEATDYSNDFINQRINTISILTNNNYLYPDGNTICLKSEIPSTVMDVHRLYTGFFNFTRTAIQNFNINREELIRLLRIDKKKINNYSTEEVLKYVDLAMSLFFKISLLQYLSLTGTTLREHINTIFNLLDFIGFWKDKIDTKSNVARGNDAGHSYFASYCDIFLSNDKRARNKVKVAYKLFGIKTEVMSYQEFLNRAQK